MHEHENVFWVAILVGILIVATMAALANAQAAPTPVDLSKALFRWTWTQGTGGMVEKWLIRCGPATNNYAILKEIVDPAARQTPLSTVITAEGTYFCVIQAANAGGASGNSPEASFRAVKVPGPATTFEVSVP